MFFIEVIVMRYLSALLTTVTVCFSLSGAKITERERKQALDFRVLPHRASEGKPKPRGRRGVNPDIVRELEAMRQQHKAEKLGPKKDTPPQSAPADLPQLSEAAQRQGHPFQAIVEIQDE